VASGYPEAPTHRPSSLGHIWLDVGVCGVVSCLGAGPHFGEEPLAGWFDRATGCTAFRLSKYVFARSSLSGD